MNKSDLSEVRKFLEHARKVKLRCMIYNGQGEKPYEVLTIDKEIFDYLEDAVAGQDVSSYQVHENIQRALFSGKAKNLNELFRQINVTFFMTDDTEPAPPPGAA